MRDIIRAIIWLSCIIGAIWLLASSIGGYYQGEKLIFTADGTYNRIEISRDEFTAHYFGSIYPDEPLTFLTGTIPQQTAYKVTIFTNATPYFDYISTAPLSTRSYTIINVTVTVISSYEGAGVINPNESVLLAVVGIFTGMILAVYVDEKLETLEYRYREKKKEKEKKK